MRREVKQGRCEGNRGFAVFLFWVLWDFGIVQQLWSATSFLSVSQQIAFVEQELVSILGNQRIVLAQR